MTQVPCFIKGNILDLSDFQGKTYKSGIKLWTTRWLSRTPNLFGESYGMGAGYRLEYEPNEYMKIVARIPKDSLI